MNRRNFLKATAAVGTLASLDAKEILKNTKNSEVYSVCEMCSSRCQINVKVKNGKVDFICGNKNFNPNKTSVCARGGAGMYQLYDEQRVVKPLIRVGKRGSGEFREASWDEALNLVAKNLQKIKDEFGPQAVIFTSKSGESHSQMANFACAFGSPNIFSHWSCCPISEKIAVPHTFGATPSRDFANSKYIVNFGHNLFEGIDIAQTKKMAKFANDPSTKLLVLDPRFSVIAAKADEWLPVKPGTDLAFIMALIHIWIRDDKYNKEFVEKFTIGFDKVKEAVKDTTPIWQEKITGIKAEVVERIADEIYKAAPKVIIDWGHKTTTTRAEYQRTRAICIANALMGNYEKKGGIFFSKKSAKFNELIGEDKFPVLANPDKNFKVPKTKRIDGSGEEGEHFFIARKHGILTDIAPAILSQKPYPVKAWVNTRFNHPLSVAGTNETIKALQKLDFIVSVDVYVNDFSNYADVILPESTYLERDESIQEKSGTAPGFCMRNKAINPIGDTKSGYEIFRQLAKIMKIDENYTWTNIEEYRMAQAKGDYKFLARLIENGYIKFNVPQIYYLEKDYVDKFVATYPNAAKFLSENGLMEKQMKFKTPSGKIELFCEKVEEIFPGEGTINPRDMDCFEGYEFCLISGKTPVHTNAHTQNIKILKDFMDKSPVWINTKSAQKLGLKTGDKVILKNKFSQVEAEIFVTQGIREDTLFVYHGFGHTSPNLKRTCGLGLNQNEILNTKDGKICGTMVTNVGVEIIKV